MEETKSLRALLYRNVEQALRDSGSPAQGPHDGGLHPVAAQALRDLARLRERPVDLPAGSLVVEKYRYTNRRGRASGVQWLVQVVNEDGDLELLRVCLSRPAAERYVREATS